MVADFRTDAWLTRGELGIILLALLRRLVIVFPQAIQTVRNSTTSPWLASATPCAFAAW